MFGFLLFRIVKTHQVPFFNEAKRKYQYTVPISHKSGLISILNSMNRKLICAVCSTNRKDTDLSAIIFPVILLSLSLSLPLSLQ